MNLQNVQVNFLNFINYIQNIYKQGAIINEKI